jgi:signal transduction histidine kinase
MNRRRRVLIVTSVLLLAAAMVCGNLMRRATDGAADPDTQEITVAEVTATVSERIAALDTNVITNETAQSAIEDQLPSLGARGFIHVRIVGRNIDVLVGTDYSLDNVMGISVQQSMWQYRLSLASVNSPEELQPLYVTYMNTGMGNYWGELIIGSAGPTAAQVRTSLSLMISMWACLCLAAVCVIAVLLLPGNHAIQRTKSWTPLRRGLALVLVGVLLAVPVAWLLMRQTRSTAREEFARGVDLVTTTSASTVSNARTGAHISAMWLHAVNSMNFPESSFRVLVDGWPSSSAGTDYGPGSYVKEGAAGEWRTLSPATGGAARSVYVAAATSGKARVEIAVPEPGFWQVIRLRRVLLWVIPAALAALFALGYWMVRRTEHAVLSPEEVLRHTVVRQTALTVFIVSLALLPAAGWFVQAYEAASLARLDQTLQRDAAQLQATLGSLEATTVATKGVELADLLEVARTGLVFSLKYTTVTAGNVEIKINPQYSLLSVVIGGNLPHYLVVANHTDASVPPGHNIYVRVMTVSNRLKDGTVYTALLGTTTWSVQQDIQELWKAATWAGPVAFLFIVLAGLIAASLALHPVAESMRRLEQFTGDAGHELRTPLSSIRLNAQVALNQDQQPEEFRRHLTAITSQVERSTHLSESLLLLARLDREQIAPLASVQLLEIWTDLLSAHAETLTAKSVTLQTPEADMTLVTNRELLTVALDNLVENAVRYAPEGTTVAITAQQTEDRVTIAVTDQGPGMPPEALPHIWDRFTRVDPSRSRESGGSGLGLAIVRKAVEAMHGHVAVTSEVGKGSTFSILLPVSWRS